MTYGHFSQRAAWFRSAPIVVISLALAVAGALYIAGFGSATSWFFSTLAGLALIGILVAKRRQPVDLDLSSTPEGTARAFWRGTLFVIASASTVGLFWLVRHHTPLPGAELRTAAFITTLLAVGVIASVLYIHQLSLLSFPGLLLGITFVFTCSPLILFQFESYDAFDFWDFVDVESVLVAMPVVMLGFSSFLLGALLVRPARRTLHIRRNVAVLNTGPPLRLVGLALYALSMIAVAGYTLKGNGLNLAFEGGYRAFAGARKERELSQLLVSSLTWFLPWSLLILAATSKDRRSTVNTLLLSLPALSIMLLAGDRGGSLTVILLFASAGLLLGLRIDWKRALLILGVVTVLFTTVQILRQIPVYEWSPELAYDAATHQVEGTRTTNQNFLEAVLTGAAPSYQTLMATVMEVPENSPYRYGRDYVRFLFEPVPFTDPPRSLFGVELGGQEPSDWVKSILNPYGWAGPGYLQAAEAYLEFGALGVVVLYVLLGWGATALWRRLSARPADPRALAFGLIVMHELLLVVRNDSSGLTRTLVWASLLVYIGPWAVERLGLVSGRRRSSSGRAGLEGRNAQLTGGMS